MTHTIDIAFERFAAMPASERVTFLQGQPITTTNQAFLDGRKRLGDESAVTVKHQAIVRGIRIGGWHVTQSEAITAATEFLSTWDGEL